MSPKKDITASGVAGQGGSGGRADPSPICPLPTKPTKLLSEREFRECFNLLNGVSVQLVDGGTATSEKAGNNTMYFSKEQFNAGLCLPLSSQRDLSADGVQHSGYVVPLGSLPVGGSLRLHHQEWKK